MYSSILVPYDGSALSARALPVAAALAARTGARVELATVHDPSAYIPFVPGEVAIPVYDQELVHVHRERDQRTLDEAVAQLRAHGVEASGVLLDGTVVEALVEHMAASGADLTILTTHGRRGFERLRLGSVASALLTRATVPVLLVRGAGSDEATSTPALPTGALLCALDGSAFAEAIVSYASTFADATGMTLHLVAVTVPHSVSLAPFGTEALLADPEALEAESRAREAYLHRIAATCPAGTTVRTVTDMSAAQGILEAATDTPCGAIALATHGRSGVKRFVLGSVADEVIRHAHVPVLVVRPTAS